LSKDLRNSLIAWCMVTLTLGGFYLALRLGKGTELPAWAEWAGRSALLALILSDIVRFGVRRLRLRKASQPDM
jgi:hypothetical protein